MSSPKTQIKTIYVPAATNAKGEQVVEPEEENVDLTGSETILLVDDDDAMRRIVTRILTKFNYTIYAADGPEIAEELFEKYGNIDLLLTDMVMPKRNGLELYASLVQRCPSLKVIFMSGFTNMIIKGIGIQQLNVPFLQKPFSINDIAGLIRKVLDEK